MWGSPFRYAAPRLATAWCSAVTRLRYGLLIMDYNNPAPTNPACPKCQNPISMKTAETKDKAVYICLLCRHVFILSKPSERPGSGPGIETHTPVTDR